MYTRTKIVCTIGPAVQEYDQILALLRSGMSVARLNFSHGTHETHLKTIELLRKARKELSLPLAIMLDMKGPTIRLGSLQNGKIDLSQGDVITLVEKGNGTKEEVPFFPFHVISVLEKGKKILFDDGYIIGKVQKVDGDRVQVEVQNSGVLKSGKSVNIPGANLPLPAMTDEDILDLQFGAKVGVDLVAASFIRSAHHVRVIKRELAENGGEKIPVIAKIESTEGVDHFDAILGASDGIMVARGDLGVEVDLSLVPKLQKMMIRKTLQAAKPVITATQMLESMIHNPRPTRAEVSDVANAIYDCSAAVMLSGETAAGKYPIETVSLMKKIVHETEIDIDYPKYFEEHAKRTYPDISSSVALAAVKTAYSCKAKAIFAITASGATARLVSRHRPEMPIIAVTASEKSYHLLSLDWGVLPVFCENCSSPKDAFQAAVQAALEKKLISFGDIVVFTIGVPFGKEGTTNMMIVETIGNIVMRGSFGKGDKVKGKAYVIHSLEELKAHKEKGSLLIFPYFEESFLSFVEEAKAIVIEKAQSKMVLSELKMKKISLLLDARCVPSFPKNGTEMTLDPEKKLLYIGDESTAFSPSLSI